MGRVRTWKGRAIPPFFFLAALAADAAAQSPRPVDEACRQALASIVAFASDRTTLDGQARCLEGQTGPIKIEGYWDDSSTQAAAVGLSQRLANAVKAEMIKAGIGEDRIQTVGYGRNRPLDPDRPFERRRAARVIVAP
jgi:outer membrane protein OmpA-like peptidoglycan-associated protein